MPTQQHTIYTWITESIEIKYVNVEYKNILTNYIASDNECLKNKKVTKVLTFNKQISKNYIQNMEYQQCNIAIYTRINAQILEIKYVNLEYK